MRALYGIHAIGSRVCVSVMVIGASFLVGSSAHADDIDNPFGSFPSGRGNVLFLSTGVLLPLLEDGRAGRAHSIQTAGALTTSSLLAVGLKNVFREKRPNSNARDSFPSGHAAAAFAVATVQSSYHPKQAYLWFGSASIIASNRVILHEHYIHDVIAGAGLGYLMARLELSHSPRMFLAPYVEPEHSTMGVSFGSQF